MIHDVKKIPIIIDFGISFQGETKPDMIEATNAFYVYGPEYTPWCLDIHLINYMFHKLESENPSPRNHSRRTNPRSLERLYE